MGYKFRRQHGIGNYIVDFYCPSLNLAIEIDGESHYTKEGETHDKQRKMFLNNLGIQTIRFTNPQVKQNLGGVIDFIVSIIDELKKNDED